MTKRSWSLVVCAFVLAVIYVCCFTDWLKPATIQISHTVRPLPARFSKGIPTEAVAFSLNRNYRLTEIKVVPLARWQTNRLVLPLWHLVSNSESRPTKFFIYGQNINGMKPAVPGIHPKSLEPGVTYRLFVSAGSIHGHHDFEIGGKPPATSTNP